jgi:hypothetical protein
MCWVVSEFLPWLLGIGFGWPDACGAAGIKIISTRRAIQRPRRMSCKGESRRGCRSLEVRRTWWNMTELHAGVPQWY